MTKRVQSLVQATKMRFLQTIDRVTLFSKVRICEIRKSLNIEPLRLWIEKSHLDGLAMLTECLRKNFRNKLYLPKLIGKDQLDDLEPNEAITLKILNEMVEVWKTVKYEGLILSCCTGNPHEKAGWRTKTLQFYKNGPSFH